MAERAKRMHKYATKGITEAARATAVMRRDGARSHTPYKGPKRYGQPITGATTTRVSANGRTVYMMPMVIIRAKFRTASRDSAFTTGKGGL